MKKNGDIIVCDGLEFVIGDEISHGQEGFVYKIKEAPEGINPTSLVAKIIKEKRMTDIEKKETYKHLKNLKKLRDRNDLQLRKYFTLPIFVLDNELGYIMGNASSYESLNNYLDMSNVEDIEKWYFNEYSFQNRYSFICSMFEGLNVLHKTGYVFTDLSPNNIMVKTEMDKKTGKNKYSLVFLDTDNIKVASESYGGIVGTGMYMAPELCSDDVLGIKRTGRISIETDIFSAAVIAFQLITLQHPFYGDVVEDADGDSDIIRKACAIRTDYILKKGTKNFCTKNLVPYFDKLVTPKIAELFERTFISGRDIPAMRPTGSEFLEAFTEAKNLIVQCLNPRCGCHHIYDVKTHQCFNCGSNEESKIFFEIYLKCYDKNTDKDGMAKPINNISWSSLNEYESSERFDVDEEDIYINNKKQSNEVVISRMIINHGEVKFVYKYQFEENCEDRYNRYMAIRLDQIEDSATIRIRENDLFKEAKLMPYTKEHSEHSFKGEGCEPFIIWNYYILFETKDKINSKMKICGRFVKE